VHEILWVWSEFDGKHKGCKFWSEKAHASNLETKHLIHEHLVPRKVITHKLFNDIPHSKQEISDFLSDFCVGVVVTKDEDNMLNMAELKSSMPDDWDNKDAWARYKKVGIKVVNTQK